MKDLQKRQENLPVNIGENFIQEAIARHMNNEPKKETNFLSNIFSRRVTNNFIRIKVYNNCTFYLGNDGEEED